MLSELDQKLVEWAFQSHETWITYERLKRQLKIEDVTTDQVKAALRFLERCDLVKTDGGRIDNCKVVIEMTHSNRKKWGVVQKIMRIERHFVRRGVCVGLNYDFGEVRFSGAPQLDALLEVIERAS